MHAGNHPIVACVIWHDHPAHPGRYIAQLATEGPLPYVLIGDTLAEVQAQLPAWWWSCGLLTSGCAETATRGPVSKSILNLDIEMNFG